MKKVISLALTTCLMIGITSCGYTAVDKVIDSQASELTTTQFPAATLSSDVAAQSQQQTQTQPLETVSSELLSRTEGIDVDLTSLNSTMIYAEVYDMLYSPENYYDKVVRMEGAFSTYEDPVTGVVYNACVIADATACCSQGLEFTLIGNPVYPDDYPALGTEIVVTGIFETYEENGYMYCRLHDSTMEIK